MLKFLLEQFSGDARTASLDIQHRSSKEHLLFLFTPHGIHQGKVTPSQYVSRLYSNPCTISVSASLHRDHRAYSPNALRVSHQGLIPCVHSLFLARHPVESFDCKFSSLAVKPEDRQQPNLSSSYLQYAPLTDGTTRQSPAHASRRYSMSTRNRLQIQSKFIQCRSRSMRDSVRLKIALILPRS